MSFAPRWTLLAVAVALVALVPGAARAEGPKLVSSPSILGVPMEGETLHAQPGSYSGAEPPFTFEYEWYRCNNGGSDCFSLGVKGPVFTVGDGDVGHRLRTFVLVTGMDCPEWTYEPPPPHRTCVPRTATVWSELTPVIQANPAFRPQNTGPPTIAGEAEESATLRAEDGGWTGTGPITTARQWERCDSGGNACAAIPGATAPTYTVTREDIARRLRVVVVASNSRGSTAPVASAPTAVVRAFLPRPGRTTVAAALVELPEKLVIDRVVFAPARANAEEPFTVRIRVSDTRGFRVRGALVRVTGVPANLVAAARDARTDAGGWARLTLRATPRVLARRLTGLPLLVRAFQPGEEPTGGVAAQRAARLRLR
jgi:hypothetical protein